MFPSSQNIHDRVEGIAGAEDRFYTAGSDGKIKMWTDFAAGGTLADELNLGAGIRAICNGPDKYSLFVADNDGFVHRVYFP